jgi:hypothetical protein
VGAITQVLVQFVFRLSFGLAVSMGLTSSRLVTSGFYRVHLWVIMGLNTFAALAVYSAQSQLNTDLATWKWQFGLAIGLSVLSYVGAVLWLYEAKRPGGIALALVAGLALMTATVATQFPLESNNPNPDAVKKGLPNLEKHIEDRPNLATALSWLDIVGGGMLLGVTMAAMLLGHWYLNTPTMQLGPLERLIMLMGIFVVLRAFLAGTGLTLHCLGGGDANTTFWLFIAFRWLAGILGPLLMARMAWITLKIPNTQSATGILYTGVILVFLGELVSQLLSADALYPV